MPRGISPHDLVQGEVGLSDVKRFHGNCQECVQKDLELS